MTVPTKYSNIYIPVKSFLSSYRALSDGRRAISLLETHTHESSFLFSDWKINWIAACTLLRSSIDLFQRDQASCLDEKIRDEIRNEWHAIKGDKESHSIFWDFLRKERDSIIHHYEWPAYEVWMDENEQYRPARISIADLRLENEKNVLLMKSGRFKGKDSVELLGSAGTWVEDRIFSAIRRAGYSPDEERNIVNFSKRQKAGPTLLSGEI